MVGKTKICKHKWVYIRWGCCYVLECTKCTKVIRAYHIRGDEPEIGDRVRFLADGETIIKIASTKKIKEVKK